MLFILGGNQLNFEKVDGPTKRKKRAEEIDTAHNEDVKVYYTPSTVTVISKARKNTDKNFSL